jgi:sugar O-acyltransferase (sialic acid O-acetyltransferase NeuD family)
MSANLKPIVILGAGDYAKEIAWVIHDLNACTPEWKLLGFLDAPGGMKATHCGLPVWHTYEEITNEFGPVFFACGIAKPAIRARECRQATDRGLRAATLLHPSVIQGPGVSIGEGSVISAGAVVGPDARVGRYCAINVQTTIGHDVLIEDFVVISPGARISGHVTLEEKAFVGANAVIQQGCRLGIGATLAAGSFLHTNLPAGQSAVGVPAKVFWSRSQSS